MERTPFWNVMFYIGIILIVVISVFPFYYAVMTSFETGTAIFRPNFLPEVFSLDNYFQVINQRNFGKSVLNSVFIAGKQWVRVAKDR